MPGDYRRRGIVLAATVAVVAVGARLGVWQLDRARQKTALQAAIASRGALPAIPQSGLARTAAEAEAQRHRRVVLRGRWLERATVYLDNRQIGGQLGGRPGFFVVTPLVWDGGAVAVQRGWIPRDPGVRTRIARYSTPAGEVEVHGRVAPPPATLHAFVPAASEAGPIRQNLDLGAWGRETGVALPPLSVLQDDPPGAGPADGLLRRWPPPAVDVGRHHGYAFQWFALAALAAILYVWFEHLRPRRDAVDRRR